MSMNQCYAEKLLKGQSLNNINKEGAMTKPNKSKKYLDGLEDKGLVKTCVIIPKDKVTEFHDIAAEMRIKHLRKEGKV